MSFQVTQEQIVPKSGETHDCEDKIFVNDNFALVVDGATSKSDIVWDEGTPGGVASQLIVETFKDLKGNESIVEAIDIVNQQFQGFYQQKGMISLVQRKPHLRLAASFIAFSAQRKEVWLVGDCQGFIGSKKIENRKKIDQIISQIRSVYLESELLLGKTPDELQDKDTGREYILPLLKRQSLFQNDPTSNFGFPAIDGFSIPKDMLIIKNVPAGTEHIVLASDGYPSLEPSLEDSEKKIKEIIESDPLMFRLFPSTKGIMKHQVSFDDRAFIRIRLLY